MHPKLIPAARRTVVDCMAVKPSEKVTIVTDDATVEVAEALAYAAREANAETVLVFMAPRRHNGEEPPPAVAAAMRECDACLLATKVSLSHTAARKAACDGGVRMASMPGINVDILTRTMDIDYNELARRTREAAARVAPASRYHLTSPNGTDMVINVEGCIFGADDGLYHHPKDFGNLPAGEVCTGPRPEGSSGVVVFDGSFAGLGLVSHPVKIRFEDGVAVAITGGEEADRLQLLLDAHGPGARMLAELGIGTHPTARLTGVVLEDEKISGTVHLALGNNLGFGGDNAVNIHLDGVVMTPTLTSDAGLEVIRDGVLLL